MQQVRKFLVGIKFNFILSIAVIFAIIAPDFISQIFNENNQATLSGKFLLGLLFFGVFLSFAPRLFVFLVLGFFILLELIQFGHLFYYNSLISSTKISLLFEEFDEVLEVATEAITFMFFVPLIVLVPYGIFFYILNKIETKRIQTKWAVITVLLMLSIIPYRVNRAYNGVNYYPDPADHSLRNSLYAYTNYLMNNINPSQRADIKYQDYKIEELSEWQAEQANIILIIGESINFRHMSLFGYKRDTNPMLYSLKKDPNFTYMKAISSGVNTLVSVPLLLNGIYEPNNYEALEKTPVNLFKLAKKHNFKNFYISSQSGALLTNVGAEFIDYAIFRKKSPILFNKYQDEAFLKIIPELDYAKNNFIVIHQRSIHAPYETNYSHNPKFNYFPVRNDNYKEFLVDTYDNAIRFNDYLIYQLIDFYKNKFKGPTYIFFTPDHGEGIGYNNIYGHSNLDEEIYNVPFLAYVVNSNFSVKHKNPICHYEIHNMIAYLLGFEINNPNIEKDICYVQGTNLYGLNEFVRYKKK